jgi:hypothetical protein
MAPRVPRDAKSAASYPSAFRHAAAEESPPRLPVRHSVRGGGGAGIGLWVACVREVVRVPLSDSCASFSCSTQPAPRLSATPLYCTVITDFVCLEESSRIFLKLGQGRRTRVRTLVFSLSD